jgi:hypothetical protein
MTFPSSALDATMESLKGDHAVSRTVPEWLLANGMISGSLDGKFPETGRNALGRGKIANAPPPEAFQFKLI